MVIYLCIGAVERDEILSYKFARLNRQINRHQNVQCQRTFPLPGKIISSQQIAVKNCFLSTKSRMAPRLRTTIIT